MPTRGSARWRANSKRCATSVSPPSDRAKATQAAVANALNAAADRIEKTTQVLNRTIGSGVAIG